MAISYVGGKGAGSAGQGGGAIDLTTGLTGGSGGAPIAGDLVIVTVSVGTAARQPTISIATPSGYTPLTAQRTTATTYDTNIQTCYKIMGSTPDTSVTIPASGNNADGISYVIQVFRGVDTTTPLDVTETYASGTATSNPDPAAIAPTTSGAWIVVCAGGAAATATNYTAGYLTNFLTNTGADTNDAAIGCGYYDAWTTGSYNPAAFTGGSATTNDSWGSTTLALRPAATQFTDIEVSFAEALFPKPPSVTYSANATFTGLGALSVSTGRVQPVSTLYTATSNQTIVAYQTNAATSTFTGIGTLSLSANRTLSLSSTYTATANAYLTIQQTNATTATFTGFGALSVSTGRVQSISSIYTSTSNQTIAAYQTNAATATFVSVATLNITSNLTLAISGTYSGTATEYVTTRLNTNASSIQSANTDQISDVRLTVRTSSIQNATANQTSDASLFRGATTIQSANTNQTSNATLTLSAITIQTGTGTYNTYANATYGFSLPTVFDRRMLISGGLTLSANGLLATGTTTMSSIKTNNGSRRFTYYEFNVISAPLYIYVGLANNSLLASSAGGLLQTTNSAVSLGSSGNIYRGITLIGTGPTFSANSVVGIAYDDTRAWFRNNSGSWLPAGDPTTGTGGVTHNLAGDLYPAVSMQLNVLTPRVLLKPDQASWTYFAPDGASALPSAQTGQFWTSNANLTTSATASYGAVSTQNATANQNTIILLSASASSNQSATTILTADSITIIMLSPIADIDTGGWVNELGSNTDIYRSIDEQIPNDTDYVKSKKLSTGSDTYEVKLASANISSNTFHTVSYRYGRTATGTVSMNLEVVLLQGSTTIANWTHTDVSETYVTTSQSLTQAQIDSITDYTDLRLRFIASKAL